MLLWWFCRSLARAMFQFPARSEARSVYLDLIDRHILSHRFRMGSQQRHRILRNETGTIQGRRYLAQRLYMSLAHPTSRSQRNQCLEYLERLRDDHGPLQPLDDNRMHGPSRPIHTRRRQPSSSILRNSIDAFVRDDLDAACMMLFEPPALADY